MTLRPDIEALVQGALDGSLSPEDRQALDQLMASDPSVRARAAELDQLAALLQSVRQVDAPPTFAADVLARIRASNDRVIEFSLDPVPTPGPREAPYRVGSNFDSALQAQGAPVALV